MRIDKLDGLRGISSMMVIIYHYHETLLPEWIGYNFFVRAAESFVDLFFVLSGFVIAMNYEGRMSRAGQLGDFMKKRFIRLYPLLLYTTLLYFSFDVLAVNLLPGLVNTPLTFRQQFRETLDTLLLTNSMPILGKKEGMNYPSWSISSEMVAYLAFGLLSVFFHGRPHRKTAFVLAVVAAAFLFCLQRRTYFLTGNFGFMRGLLCFNLGNLVFHLSRSRLKIHNGVEYLLPLSVCAVFFAMERNSGEDKQLFALFSIPLLFMSMILVLTKTEGAISRLLGTVPMQYLGRISYSIYLNHAIVILILPRFVFSVLHVPKQPVYEILTLCLSLVVVVVYSGFTYRFIELKGGEWMRRAFFGPQPVRSGTDATGTLKPFEKHPEPSASPLTTPSSGG